MEEKKLGVYKDLYSKRSKRKLHHTLALSNIMVLILSICLPILGMALCVIWWNERRKDRFFPLFGTIIGFVPYVISGLIIIFYPEHAVPVM